LPDGGDLVDLPVDLPVDPVPDEATATRVVGINRATPAEVGRATEPMRSDRRASASSGFRAVALPSI
jgi:hypothetical protein